MLEEMQSGAAGLDASEVLVAQELILRWLRAARPLPKPKAEEEAAEGSEPLAETGLRVRLAEGLELRSALDTRRRLAEGLLVARRARRTRPARLIP